MKKYYLPIILPLILLSCSKGVHYFDSTKFGNEKIIIDTKSESFKFYRTTPSNVFANQGSFIQNENEITLLFSEIIMDSRYLPNCDIQLQEPSIETIGNDKIIIQLIDLENKKPVQLQNVFIYNANLVLHASLKTDFNGSFELDKSLAGNSLIIYCSYWNPISLDIPNSTGIKIQSEIRAIGTFENSKPSEDVIIIEAVKYSFEFKKDEMSLIGSQKIKTYTKKKKKET